MAKFRIVLTQLALLLCCQVTNTLVLQPRPLNKSNVDIQQVSSPGVGGIVGRPLHALAPSLTMSGLASQQQQQGIMKQQNSQSIVPSNPYTNATHTILLDLRQQLITRALKFDDYFKNLLTQSKLSLHKMFVATYGMMYEHNSEIFANMYESLEHYYATGQIELTKSMDSFFERLYQKIFQVFNSNRAFSANYLECATNQLTHLKPFGDAPEKLIVDIRHALVAARTFNQALNAGIDIIKNIISLGDPPQCINLISEKLLRERLRGVSTRELTNNKQWSAVAAGKLQQQQQQQPCFNFCEQVILRCVGRANLDPLAERWKSYALALSELAKKLTVQYNIETVIGPIDVQISEAIMNFQENAGNITERVYAACGDPKQSAALAAAAAVAASSVNLAPVSAPKANLGHHHAGMKKREAVARTPFSTASLTPSSTAGRRHPPGNYRTASTQLDSGFIPAMATPQRVNVGPSLEHAQQQQQQRAALGRASPMPIFETFDSSSPPLVMGGKPPVIIGEIRDYILSVKNFWSSLPSAVCNSTLNANLISGHPINNIRRNQQLQQQQQPQCFQEALTLSDMNSDLRYRNEIQQQVHRLEMMHSKIVDALHGVEIEWSVGVGSGSSAITSDKGPQQPQAGGRPVAPTQTHVSRPTSTALAPSQATNADSSEQPPNDNEPDEYPDELDEPGSGDETGASDAEESSYDYPSSSTPNEDESTLELDNSAEEASPTMQPSPDSNPNSSQTAEDNSIDSGKSLDDLNQINGLITVDPSPRRSSAYCPSNLVVIYSNSSLLLLVCIIYCTLSAIFHNNAIIYNT